MQLRHFIFYLFALIIGISCKSDNGQIISEDISIEEKEYIENTLSDILDMIYYDASQVEATPIQLCKKLVPFEQLMSKDQKYLYYYLIGQVFKTKNNFFLFRESLQEALKNVDTVGGINLGKYSKVCYNIADANYSLFEFKRANEYFEKALDISSKVDSFKNTIDFVAHYINNLKSQQKFEQCDSLFEVYYPTIAANDSVNQQILLKAQGWRYLLDSQAVEAKGYFERVSNYMNSESHYLVSQDLSFAQYCNYYELNNYKKSFQYWLQNFTYFSKKEINNSEDIFNYTTFTEGELNQILPLFRSVFKEFRFSQKKETLDLSIRLLDLLLEQFYQVDFGKNIGYHRSLMRQWHEYLNIPIEASMLHYQNNKNEINRKRIYRIIQISNSLSFLHQQAKSKLKQQAFAKPRTKNLNIVLSSIISEDELELNLLDNQNSLSNIEDISDADLLKMDSILENKSLLVFLFARNRVNQIFVNKREIYYRQLLVTKEDESNIDYVIQSLTQNIQDVAVFENQGFALYQKYFKEYIDTSNADQELMYLSDWKFLQIPIESLPYRMNDAKEWHEMDYLLSKTIVSNVVSLRSILDNKSPHSINSIKTFAISNVVNEKGEQTFLANAIKECNVIKELFGEVVEVYSNKQGNKKEFIDGLINSEIIHVSSHGESTITRENVGHLYFNNEQINQHSDSLTVQEVYQNQNLLKSNCRFVFLATCNSSSGFYSTDEGLTSMSRAIHTMTKSNVIGSLWPANEFSSNIIVQEFYSNLTTSFKPSIHLRSAKVNYLKDNSNAFSSPFYWANYQYYGE